MLAKEGSMCLGGLAPRNPNGRSQSDIRSFFPSISTEGQREDIVRRMMDFIQPTAQEELVMTDTAEFGDNALLKYPQSLRVIQSNVNNLPPEPYKEKSRSLIEEIKSLNPDVVCLQETGLNYTNLDETETWRARTYRKLEGARTSVGHNYHFTIPGKRKRGGTAIITMNEATPRVSHPQGERDYNQGNDPEGLGRWVCVTLDRKGPSRLRIVSLYNPCYNSGFFSTWQQQVRRLDKQGRDTDPRNALLADFKLTLYEWLDNGDEIIVCMDANEDVRSGPLSSMLREMGLRDAILDKHGAEDAPATHYRNDQQTPIDAIFTTLEGDLRGGYLAVDAGLPGDHRTLWLDIPFISAFNHNAPNLTPRLPNGINTQDPRIRRKYNRRVVEEYKKEDIINKAALLREMVQEQAASDDIELLHSEIDQKVLMIRTRVAQELRRKKAGKIPWSPQFQLARAKVKLWTVLENKHKRQQRLHRRYLHRLMKNANNNDALGLPLLEIVRRKTEAIREYKAATKKATQNRKDHLDDLAEAIAKEKNERKSQVLLNLKHRESQKRRSARMKTLKSKQKGSKVASMRYEIEGIVQDLFTKEEMEKWSMVNRSCTIPSLSGLRIHNRAPHLATGMERRNARGSGDPEWHQRTPRGYQLAREGNLVTG